MERKLSQLNAAEKKLQRAIEDGHRDPVSEFTLKSIREYLNETEGGRTILKKHGQIK